jgi:tetratricopeptide (TPR) repeat protein
MATKKTPPKSADKPAAKGKDTDAKQKGGKADIDSPEARKDAPFEAPAVFGIKTPIDARFYEGPRIVLEGETGIPDVDKAIKEGIDPASSPTLMAKMDEHYSNEDLLKMVQTGEVEVEDIRDRESPFTEENVRKFILGEITWGQLQGLTMDEAYAYAELGYTQFEQGRYNEAQAIFEGLVISNPYDAYFHCMLGAIYARKDMQEEAAEEYTIAIELDPENVAAYVNRAEILLQHGEFEIAMEDLKNAIKLDPKGEDPSGIRARALAAATAAVIEEILAQRKKEEGASGGAAKK